MQNARLQRGVLSLTEVDKNEKIPQLWAYSSAVERRIRIA